MNRKLLSVISIALIIVTVVTALPLSASAASTTISSGVKGISLKIEDNKLLPGESLVITPVIDSIGTKHTKSVVATLGGKKTELKINKKNTLKMPSKNLGLYTLKVTYKFRMDLPVTQSSVSKKKVLLQNYAGISASVYVVADMNAVIKKAKNTYPQGSKCSYIKKYSAYQCHAFACFMSDTAFGAGKPTTSNEAYEYFRASSKNGIVNSIRVGDLVRYRSTKSFNHSIFVTKIDGTYIYYADANSDGKCTVKYNQRIKKSELEKLMRKRLLTDDGSVRYGYIAHYKNNYL